VRHLESYVKLVLLRLDFGVFMSDVETVLLDDPHTLLQVLQLLKKSLVYLP
jgi:hypothetical protein